jgi:hypothetical protein
MIVLQQRSHAMQVELARVLGVTTQAWGLREAGPRQARPRRIAIRTQTTQCMPWQSNWSRVTVQSLRWAI